MENPTTTPSAAQQAENKGSERMFSQEELNTTSLQIGLPVSAPSIPSAWATLTHEKKT